MFAQPVIQTHELTKSFNHPLFFWRKCARALSGLTMSVEPGEVYGLLGPNGSGKSTTIKLILGMLWPTAGQVAVFGHRPTAMLAKEKTGFLPEESHLYRFLNAEETLDFYGRLFHIPRVERRKRIDALLEMTGLWQERYRPVAEFSKGMQRRVGLAQALINDPELVILDEPTSGMDPIGTREIKNLILELKDKRKTVLLSSHLLSDVEDVCDRVAILYGGQVRAEGPVSTLLSDEKRVQITAEMDDETIDEVIELIQRRQGEDVDIDVAPPMERLEQYFIRVVNEAESEGAYTSGADNRGNKHLDFITEEEAGEELLDKLSAKPAAAPEPVRPVEEAFPETAPDQVLERLRSASRPAPVAPQTPEARELTDGARPDTDILNRLSGKGGNAPADTNGDK